MQNFDLGLLPSGHLYPSATQPESNPIADAFTQSAFAGLFSLAILKKDKGLLPAVKYWRSFAIQYLTARCLLDLPGEDLASLSDGEINHFLLNAPPMQGAEYLSEEVLQTLWQDLDHWLLDEIATAGSLADLLSQKAPHWHQLGRVCFHLAENKADPDYPFAFMATYAPELSTQGRARHLPLNHALQEYAGSKNKAALIKLLSPVQLVSETCPLIKDLIDSGDIYHPLAWTPGEAYQFLKNAVLYEQCGVVVRLPDWWKKRSRPQVGVKIGDAKKKRFDRDSLLDFQLNVALAGETLTQSEFQEIMDADSGLLFIKGQWVEVDQAKLNEALAHWKNIQQGAAEGLTFIEGMRLLAGAPADLKDDLSEDGQAWSFVEAGDWLSSQLAGLRSPEQIKASKPGRALKATLRPYQQQGVSWLHLLSQLGLGACLADDMGLGKTIQIISLLLLQKKRLAKQPALLVLPASLLANWKAELARFAPSLNCVFLHRSQLNKKQLEDMASSETALQDVDVILTTYATLTRQSWLLKRQWQLLVLDEAQAIKNPSARQTKAVKKIKANSRIALTGTPIENRIADLWSLFDFLNPGLLGTASRFKSFIKSLSERPRDQYAPLRNLVSPYILRRMKTDRSIIQDLPDKTELSAFCGLSKAQAAQYQMAVSELTNALENLTGMQRRGLVLSYLMRFKQICNHPSLLLGDGKYDPAHSGKFQRLAELCEEIASRQEKVLVFTQFREMTEPLAAFLSQQFGRPGLILHGGTPVKQRQKLVEQFQTETGPPFFVLSLKAGGTGLTLTHASHVIHFDRWWNPAVENQATDRAFRIGQKKNVLVHKFVCQGTVEEKIDFLINEKTELADNMLNGGAETLLTEMDNATIIDLVSLDIDKAQL